MTDKYNTPCRDEILTPIIDTNGQPQVVYNVKMITDDSIVVENVYFELVNQITQKGTWATADIINGIIGKNNAQTELISTLMLLAELKDDIRSTGDDNLEVFGISDAARIGILNNHGDFGVLAETVAAGENQIKVINASGYRYEETVNNVNLYSPNTNEFWNSMSARMENGNLLFLQIRNKNINNSRTTVLAKYNPTTKIITHSNGYGGRATGLVCAEELNLYGWVAETNLTIYNDNTGTNFNATGLNNSNGVFYCDIDKRFYAIISGTSSPYTLMVYRSGVVSKSTTSVAFTLYSTLTGFTQALNDGLIQVYKQKGLKYAIYYGGNYGSNDVHGKLFILNNYNSFSIFTVGNGLTYINDVIAIGNLYLVLGNDTLSGMPVNTPMISFPKTADGRLDTSATATSVNIPFLNGRKILKIWENNNIAYLSGTDSLLGYSLDGINWSEIIMSDDGMKNSIFSNGATSKNGEICLINAYGSTLSNYGISLYKPFDVEAFKNKRYKLGNEFITVTDVQTVSDNIILNLQNNLSQNHTAGAFMLRTTNSTIQPNRTQTITVEIDNLYTHNAAVAIPIFTSLENVTVTAEICQRNNETEIEEWVPFPLINSLDVKGWKKNTYFKVFEQAKMVTAIAFTVVNNNDAAVELHQLNVGLSDEIYELGGE